MDARLISVARGQAPADLILANANVVNVFTGEIERGNVAIVGSTIAGVGDYSKAKDTIDLGGRYLAPGFIDAHVHLESSMLDPGQYARAVVPRGTLTVVTDLHEIANVAGIPGMRWVMNFGDRLPLDLLLMAPSCVPATNLETSGASLDAAALRQVLRWKNCIGLGEMMNFPGVINGDKDALAKIDLAQAQAVDGHAPGLSGNDLNAYIAAGIRSDHESVSLDEAREKLKRGMHVMVREGSSEKNLEALLPLVNDRTARRCMLVVDDRTCVDIVKDGDIDAAVRKAVRSGLTLVRAVQMVTINPAEYFGLVGMGAVAPGYRANLVVINDLANLRIGLVFYNGQLVAAEGKPLFGVGRAAARQLTNTVNIKPFGPDALRIKSPVGAWHAMPVIEIVPGQIITKRAEQEAQIKDGAIVPDVERDILKLAVVERHKATGNIGLGLVKGFGLKQGALASSVAHDSHNIIAVGADDESLFTAVKEVERMQGGLVAVKGKDVLAGLALPIAGLLSSEPAETVVEKLARLEEVAKQLGTTLPSPFSTLSFLALPVIPELRLTDMGLVDVNEFRLIT